MIGFAKNMFGADCTIATKEMVQAERKSKELADRYLKIANGETDQKRFCPILLPNGISQTGSRLNKDMIPTGNIFLDYDEKGSGWKILWDKVKDHLSEWGILLVEKSARGGGHMIVKRRPNYSIEEDIDYWGKKLELTFDNVKDLARAMYLVPQSNVLYESDELYTKTNFVDTSTSLFIDHTQKKSTNEEEKQLYSDFVGDKEEWAMNYTIVLDSFKEKGVKVRDIALRYLEVVGYEHEPEKGADGNRHNIYVELAKGCKKLADANDIILLVQLPSLGLSVKERINIIKSITKVCTSTIPHDFFCFLRDNDFLKTARRVSTEENPKVATQEQKEKAYKAIKECPKVPLPSFIPFPFKPYIDCAPEEYKEPMMFALVPVMYLLRPRIRIPINSNKSFGMDTKEYDYCLNQTIIFGPPASGKSFVKLVVKDLTKRLKELDKIAQAEAISYQESVTANKYNSKSQPKKDSLKMALRLIPAKTSPPALLEMQREARGLSQLFFCEELDTFSKAASDGTNSSMSINDILRVAFNGGTYSQRFMNKETFQGEVNIFLNVLATGTYNQKDSMFTKIDNGLVTRYNFAFMPDKWDGEKPYFKPFRQKDVERMKEFLDDCFFHTYKDADGIERVDWYDVDVLWARPIFDNWAKQKIIKASETFDYATKAFVPRIGDMMYRLMAFIRDCYKDEKQFEKDKPGILKFCDYYGETTLRNMLQLFGLEYNERNWAQMEKIASRVKPQSDKLIDRLPDIFDKDDVAEIQKELGHVQEVTKTISKLKERGLIKIVKGCKNLFTKK